MPQWRPCVANLSKSALWAIVAFIVIAGLLSAIVSSMAQSTAECGGPQARAFDFWIGEWDIRQRILQEDGTYVELPAKTSVSVALDGCALIEHWEGEVEFFWEGMQEPESLKGLSVRAYDPRETKWLIHWMDTRSRRFDVPYVGEFVDGRGEFYRESETADGTRVDRITFSDISPDSLSWSLYVSTDGRQSWTTVWMMEMLRIGR